MSTTNSFSCNAAMCVNYSPSTHMAFYSLIALGLAVVALSLAPSGEAAAIGQCVCALAAMVLGFSAERAQRAAISTACELLASLALLASASAAVMQGTLAQPQFVSNAWIGLAWFSGAFSFAVALLGASKALQRLGSLAAE
jgi:hypothetical protein